MAKAKTSKQIPPKAGRLLPSAGYILIEPQEAQSKTIGGIYLPETATTEKPQKGKVLAVGANEITDSGASRPAPVKVGDIVIYKKWGGNEVKHEEKELMFVKFDDILATVN